MMNKSVLKIKAIFFLKSIFGEEIVEKILLFKYIKRYKKSKVVFIHIPKAAGTSISEVLYGKRNGHLRAENVKKVLGEELYNKKYSFSVTRNPYDRLVSAYNFARQGQTKEGAIALPEQYQTSIFETFESFVVNWLVNQDLEKLDPVFQPQHIYIFDDANQLIVTDLFKLEEIEKVEQMLSDKLSKEIKIGKKNKSKGYSSKVYSHKLREIVYGLYKKDFMLLGYEK